MQDSWFFCFVFVLNISNVMPTLKKIWLTKLIYTNFMCVSNRGKFVFFISITILSPNTEYH